jgi:sulfhydrogenase subunit beta (sulfur reductase)
MKYITRDDLFALLDLLKDDYEVFVPFKKDEQRFFKKYESPSTDIAIGEVRPFEPLKAFFSRAREVVAENFSDSVPHADDKPFAIVGVKACDLKGFKVQDHVFTDHDYQDPIYIRNREANLIISADCTCVIDTCFCRAVGIQPYAQENYDINLSETGTGYVVDIGSPKGEAVVAKHAALFKNADQKDITGRDTLRTNVAGEVDKKIKESSVPDEDSFKGIVERNLESNIWADEAKECVECGACNVICPTCHCFLLYDQKDEKRMERLRIWDSCMIKDFARVAGGANPRPQLWMRLRNRFEKKFDYFPKVADVYACTGCGRCISACPAKIDIRKVLRRLVENV